MARGRPTKYKKEYIELASDYLKTWNTLKPVGKFEHAVPTELGFLTYYGIPRSTSNDWAKDHPEYSYILGQIKELGGFMYGDRACKGEIKEGMAKFQLSSRYGLSEKTETKQEVSGGLTVTWEK